ncbi:hypothetical protein BDR07DRAFT_1484823 [Suillus spraguei]|nr:hypothetical protein BDR07DRAFT_1484823 [Suillus spraguei]
MLNTTHELSRTIAPSTSIKNLGIDLTVWSPPFQFICPSIPKHVEEITLTGFATQDLTGKREDAYSWARLLFLAFYDTVSRLEHVSCVVVGPDVKTTFEYSPDCIPIHRSEDNRTRGHRAANDVWELMPLPVACCWRNDDLCDAYSRETLQLNRAEMERRYLWRHWN